MSAFTNSPSAGTGGFYPDINEVRVFVRGGDKYRGQVCVLDEAASDAAVTSSGQSESSIHRNVILPATNSHYRYGKPVVLLDDIDDDRQGLAARGGQVYALVSNSGGAASGVRGDPLVLSSDGSLNRTLTATYKVVAKLAQDISLTATPQMALVILSDSDGGFGTVISP